MNLSKQDLIDIQDIIGREPSEVEKHIFDTMWSEHCSYKSSKPTLKTLPTKGSEVALGIGEDSGIIRFTKHEGKQYCIAISHESHNHPSQILPIEGAATGVGGVVRDVYCMGADVVGVMNSLHFGIDDGNSPMVDEIAQEVVTGVSDYANPLGVPVLGGETLYHSSYNDNCLVNVAAVGLIEEEKIIHSYVPKDADDEPYDIILFGKSTDATGFGGASFSSATLDNENEAQNIGAVQVHDPFLKRVSVEAIKYLLKVVHEKKVPIGFKDLGAGGISCAGSEIAVGGGYGVIIDLDKVNTAFDNLPPEVIACSETQERFCLAVPRWFSEEVLDIFNNKFDMPSLYHKAGAAVIGEVIPEKIFRIIHKGECVCELPVEAITTDVKAVRTSEPREINRTVPEGPLPEKTVTSLSSTENLNKLCQAFIKQENNKCKRYVYRYFDNAVRGDTVTYPGETDAVVCTPIHGCNVGLTVSIDSNLYGSVDPYISGAAAVAESIRNVISVGGRPIALTDCLNFGNPEKPSAFFEFEEGVKGIADAANNLGVIEGEPVPIISGNVSFYNESKQGAAIVPSPVIVCIGRVEDYHKTLTAQVRQPGETLILIGKRYAEFGGTQIKEQISELNNVAPQVRFADEKKQNKAVSELINSEKISSCHDISTGGLFMSIAEMILGERGLVRAGIELELQKPETFKTLFSENGGYIISIDESNKESVLESLNQKEIDYEIIGKTTSSQKFKINGLDLDIQKLKEAWMCDIEIA